MTSRELTYLRGCYLFIWMQSVAAGCLIAASMAVLLMQCLPFPESWHSFCRPRKDDTLSRHDRGLNSSIHPSIGVILCTERLCCQSSLLGYWAQSWTGHHSNTGYSNGSIIPASWYSFYQPQKRRSAQSTPPGIN